MPDTNSVIESQTKASRPPVTETLAAWIASVTYEEIPAEIQTFAKCSLADTFGGAVAACEQDVVRQMLAAIEGETGNSLVWGTSVHTSARNAALVNGAMAHAHDFDDNNRSMMGHPSAPVLPAVLALADERDVSGADIVLAYLVGVEIEGKLGLAMTYEHNGRGWHTTSTLGAIGAAAAAAKLLKLDATATQNALAIAVSMASGVRQNFGTMTKPLHVGLAAQNGVLAAKLAAQGINGSPRAIEGHEGLFDMFTDPGIVNWARATGGLGTKFEILQNIPKIHSSCSAVHTAIDIVQAGLAEGEIVPGDVEKIVCGVSYHALNLMRYVEPKDHLEARFSIPYCIAAATIRGKLGIAEFDHHVIASADIRDLIRRIEVTILPELATQELFQKAHAVGEAHTDLEVFHRSGKIFKMRLQRPRGHPRSPLSADELRSKFVDCLARDFTAQAGRATWTRFMQLDTEPAFRPSQQLSRAALSGHSHQE